MRNARPVHIISYDGFDLPGLLNTILQRLYDVDFNIVNVSMASGGGKYQTFISCQRNDFVSDSSPTEPEFTRIRLQQDMTDNGFLSFCVKDAISEYFLKYPENGTNYNASIPTIPVKTMHTPQSGFVIGLEVVVVDKPGFTACLTNLFKRHFSMEDDHIYSFIDRSNENPSKNSIHSKFISQIRLPDASADAWNEHEAFIKKSDLLDELTKTFEQLSRSSAPTSESKPKSSMVERIKPIDKSVLDGIEEAHDFSPSIQSSPLEQEEYLYKKGSLLLFSLVSLIELLDDYFETRVPNLSIFWDSVDFLQPCGLRLEFAYDEQGQRIPDKVKSYVVTPSFKLAIQALERK